jgi:hypothetical protein
VRSTIHEDSKPGNTDGTYIQEVPLVGITPGAPLVFKKGSGSSRNGTTMSWRG